jgi:protein phosphatase 2C family protein 2/3
MPISPEDEWLLIGTDGLFDVFDTDELATIVQRWVKTHERATVCQALVDEALRRNSTDNVTAMIVFFDANNPAAVPKTS